MFEKRATKAIAGSKTVIKFFSAPCCEQHVFLSFVGKFQRTVYFEASAFIVRDGVWLDCLYYYLQRREKLGLLFISLLNKLSELVSLPCTMLIC